MSTTQFQFTKATKRSSYLRAAFVGPPGSGKTYSALRVMRGLLGAGVPIAVIDTERGSASKYSDVFDFQVLELPSFEPNTYVAAMQAAAEQGFRGLIVDSLSHAWVGKGGALEQVDRRSGSGSSFNAWRDVTPMHNKLVEALLTYPGHLIATMRVKTEYVVEEVVKNGKKTSVPRKVGMAPVQRDGLEYEFDVVGDLNHDNTLSITKTRCSALNGAFIDQPGEEMGRTLAAWLSDGAAPAPVESKPAPAAQQPSEQPKSDEPPFDLDGILFAIRDAEDADDLRRIAATIGTVPKEAQAAIGAAYKAQKEKIARVAASAPASNPAEVAA